MADEVETNRDGDEEEEDEDFPCTDELTKVEGPDELRVVNGA